MVSLRPDELAANAEMQREKNLGRGVKTAAALGATALSSGLSSRILPFINQFISPDLAIRGISKVSPKIGDFLKKGQEQGLNIEEGLNFVKEQFQPKEHAKENRNIIQQYSPELHEFLDQEIKKGRKPIEAGALAQNDKRFSKIIEKLSKDHKTPWSNILESVYGDMQKNQPSTPQAQPSMTQTAPNQQQPGQGQQALMAMLQKLQQARRG